MRNIEKDISMAQKESLITIIVLEKVTEMSVLDGVIVCL